MPRKVCVIAGCPTISDKTRCPAHRREYERDRGSSTARGYDAAHRALRAAWQARIDTGEHVMCWRCKKVTITSGIPWDLGHSDHDRSVTHGPECIPCNRATKGRTTPLSG